MTFYRVGFSSVREGHEGYAWFTQRAAAKKAAEQYLKAEAGDSRSANIEAIGIVISKAGILTALRAYASHPDNG